MRTEVWTWAYLTQQVVMLGIWIFLLSMAWEEVCAWRVEMKKKTGPRNRSCTREKNLIKRRLSEVSGAYLSNRSVMVKEKAE
jgi:hypothetical protein